tara:strand:+ start:1764 stop:2714 length:951 start_codon:yes stop_codon:yes gene_type:complete
LIERTFKVLIVLICFVFIYKYIIDNENIINIIININYTKFLFIILLVSLLIFLYSKLLLTTLTDLCKIKIPKLKWYLIYFNSQFLNSIPLFGIFYRAAQLKKFNLNYDKFVGIYILISWFFLFLSLLFFSIETFFILKNFELFDLNLSLLLFFLSLFFLFIPIVLLKFVKLIISKLNIRDNYFVNKLDKLINLFLISLSNKIFLKNFFLIFLLIHFLEFFILSLLFNSLEGNVGFENSFILFMGNTLIDMFNLLPQNLIISEIGLGLLTDQMNFNFELGVLIKIYFRFIVFFSSVFIAILYNIILIFLNKNLKDNV